MSAPQPQPSGEQVAGLTYAPTPKRRRVWRVAAVGVFVGLLALGDWQWGPALRHHIGDLIVERRCMNLSESPGRVVYDDDPNTGPHRTGEPGYVEDRRLKGAALWAGKTADDYPLQFAAEAVQGLVFSHRLRRPDGQERLVIVQVRNNGVEPELNAKVWQPLPVMSLYAQPAVKGPTWAMLTSRDNAAPAAPGAIGGLRLFAGQADSTDCRHFTIGYEFHGQVGAFDGRLDNWDEVNWTSIGPILPVGPPPPTPAPTPGDL